mgnify:CR=1 FL=1
MRPIYKCKCLCNLRGKIEENTRKPKFIVTVYGVGYKFEGKKIEPLLNDKPRTMVYIQSSGGNVPWMLRPILNKGLNYVEDIIKFMGIKKFEELLVDDTGFTE